MALEYHYETRKCSFCEVVHPCRIYGIENMDDCAVCDPCADFILAEKARIAEMAEELPPI